MSKLFTIVAIIAFGLVKASPNDYGSVDTSYKPQPTYSPPYTTYPVTVNPGGPIKPVGPVVSPGGPIKPVGPAVNPGGPKIPLGPGPVVIHPYPTVNPGGPIIRPTSTPIAYPISVKPQPIADPVPYKVSGAPVYS